MKTNIKNVLMTTAISLIAAFSWDIVRAASFDCNRAARPQEKFICQHAEVSKLDEDLAKVYRDQTKILPREAQTMVLSSQRSWLAYWPRACSASPTSIELGADAIGCVGDHYRQRLKELGVLPVPVGRIAFTVSEYSFNAPKAAGEAASTHTISYPQVVAKSSSDLLLNAWLARDIRKWRTSLDGDSNSELSVALTMATVKLIQATESSSWYGHGAAHPQSGRANHYFLAETDRVMRPADFFTGNRWVEIVASYVFKELKEKLGEQLQIERSENLKAAVSTTANWSIGKASFSLQFNPYEVAPYSEGFVEVEVPMSLIRPHLTPLARELLAQ